MSPSTAVGMLQHCCNVTKVSLETCLSGDDVQKVAELKYLQKLEIFWINSIPIKPIITACSKLKELVLTEWIRGDKVGSYDYLYEWVHAGFKPPNLSIINPRGLDTEFLMLSWSNRNSLIPASCAAHFKAYYVDWYSYMGYSYFHSCPRISARFWPNCYISLYKASNFGLFGFGRFGFWLSVFKNDWLYLNKSTFNDKVVYELKATKTETPLWLNASDICCSVDNLNIVTDFNVSCFPVFSSQLGILSSHLEQLSSVCPNLE